MKRDWMERLNEALITNKDVMRSTANNLTANQLPCIIIQDIVSHIPVVHGQKKIIPDHLRSALAYSW